MNITKRFSHKSMKNETCDRTILELKLIKKNFKINNDKINSSNILRQRSFLF